LKRVDAERPKAVTGVFLGIGGVVCAEQRSCNKKTKGQKKLNFIIAW